MRLSSRFRTVQAIPLGFVLCSAVAPFLPSSRASSSASLQATALKTPLVSTGIKNLGNTCYLSSQLECAFHIPLIRKLAMAEPAIVAGNPPSADEIDEDPLDTEDAGDESKTPEETPDEKTSPAPTESEAKMALRGFFGQMIDAASQPLRVAAAPRAFCMQLGIPPMVQQDSQEFWKLLLPALEDERISDLYKGSFEDYIVALDGSGREKRREELFLDLSLDVGESKTLLESLNATFGTPEKLSAAEGNGWRPEKGADKVDAHKGSKLIAQGLPPVLQFHLKRFTYDWQTDHMNKVNSRLAFPTELDLSTICKSHEGQFDATETSALCLYDLQSIVIHMGEYGVGHYYAYVRPDVNCDTWYRFNDDIVEEVTEEDVMEDAYGGRVSRGDTSNSAPVGFWGRLRRILPGGVPSSGDAFGWGGRTSNAYVVQYVRRSDCPRLYCID